MIFESHEQGSTEWFAARAGVITASRFSDAVDKLKRASDGKKAGDRSGKSETYAFDLALERISGQPYGDTFQTFAMKRGSELEAQARMVYESRTMNFVTEAGIVLTDDRTFGYSTDGFVGDDGMIEVKCPLNSGKVLNILQTGDVSEYIHQMQGGLWITGRKWCDFIMYCPALESVGRDLYIKRIERDEAFIESLEADLLGFAAFVNQTETFLRQKAA